MLYETLKRQKAKYGLTEELKQKIDMFYLAGRLTEEQYRDLMDLPPIAQEMPELEQEILEPVELVEEQGEATNE